MRTANGFPGVIVMPEGANSWYANWWRGGRRGDPAWERYHLDELIALVEQRLPIRRGRRWHAFAGWSMGGSARSSTRASVPATSERPPRSRLRCRSRTPATRP